MAGLYHLCFVVQDIDAATRELTETLGVAWNPIQDGRLGEWDYRIVFSVEGPPFLELVEGPPGSPWDASDGSRFDHLGFWSADVDADKRRLAERGAALDFDGTDFGRPFTYHRLDEAGGRLELVDTSVQPGFLRTWAPRAAPMTPLNLDTDVLRAVGVWDRASGDAVAACRAVLVDFLAAIDRGRATDALDHFTDDASFDARGRQLHGRDEIATFLEERQAETHRRTVHVIANDVAAASSAGEITLTALLLLYERAADGTCQLDRILDTTQTFRRDPTGWRIRHRATTPTHPPEA